MTFNYDKEVLNKYPKYIGIVYDGYRMKIKKLYAEVTDSVSSPNKPAPLYLGQCEHTHNGTMITDFSVVKHGNDIMDLFV